MEGRRPLRDTHRVVAEHQVKASPSRTRTLAEEQAAVGARWERTTGSSIGRYVIEERLGAGAMGVVYGALDPKLGRRVAIKMAHASQARSERGAERFIREARAMAALDHPNVVGVFDFGVRDDEAFLVMERVEAQTLSKWLETSPTFDQRLRVLREAGAGLAAAHAAGLVHRDFKPDNVLITAGGQAKVTDFGLARAYGDDDSSSQGSKNSGMQSASGRVSNTVTAHGVVIGTPVYMSPEQHRARPLTPKSDQYSYSITAYEVLTGERLFEANSLMQLETRKDDGPALDAFRGLPLSIARALRRGLQPRERDRFDDLPALLRALEPGAGRLWLGLSAAALLPMALVAIPRSDASESRCGDPVQDAQSMWGASERDAMRRVFDGSSSPGASQTGERVLTILDGEVEAWVQAREAACALEASQRDLAEACLERRRDTFETVRDRISVRGAVSVEVALPSIEGLGLSEDCLRPLSARLEAARLDPTVRAYLDEVQRRKAGARDALRVGDRFAALAELDAALEAILAIEPPALRAKPLSVIGDLLDTVGDPERASKVLRQAYDLARAADDDENAAAAAVHLIWVEGVALGDPAEGRRWAREAQARMESFEVKPDMASTRWINLAAIAQQERDLDKALELMLTANEVALAGEGVASPARQNVLLMARGRREHNIGALRYWRGEYELAQASFQRSVAAIQAARGIDHPDAVDGMEGISRAAEAAGDLDLARVTAKTMVRILEMHRGKDHPSVGSALRTLASVEYAVGDLQEVRRLFEQIVALLEGQSDEEFRMEAATARVELCTVLRELGEIEDASVQAQLAYESFEEATDPEYAGHRAGALRELALIHSDLGQHDAAVEYLERAFVAARDTSFEVLNLVVFAIARVYVFSAAGRHDDAIAAGEAGLELAKAAPDSVDAMLLELRLAEAYGHRRNPGDYERATEILDGIEKRSEELGLEALRESDLQETRAEIEAANPR